MMIKDKEWLKSELRDIRERNDRGNNFEGAATINLALRLIDQLDEPETLSQEWIESKTWYNHYVVDPFVFVDDLQNLLVPKQEELVSKADELKPVVPQFVADWYEKNEYDINQGIYELCNEDSHWKLDPRLVDWVQDSQIDFAEILISMKNGYEAEKEQKYQVIIRDGKYMRLYLSKHDGIVTIGTNDNYIEKCPEVTYLTEQEIKGYDERFWAFAVPVEELEE